MAQVTAEQLLNKVQQQAGRIAQLELINDAMAIENVDLAAKVARLEEQTADVEIRDVAADISNGRRHRGPKTVPSA